METLDDKVRRYKTLLDLKAELEERTKENNKAKEALEQEICQMMVEEEKPSTVVDGYNYSLSAKTYYSKKSEDELMELERTEGVTFFGALRGAGLGDIIVERVDAKTLNSAVNNLMAEEGELPAELDMVLKPYDKMSLSKRKANTRALSKAKKGAAYA